MHSKLSPMDSFALRRYMSRMNVDGIEVSPAMKLLLASIDGINPDLANRRLTRALEAHPDIMRDVLHIDPTTEPELTSRLINANRLKDLTRPEYIITDYPFYAGMMNALVGGSGKGKSFLSLDFAGRYAVELDEGKIIYIAAEGLHGYAPRWEAWVKHHQQSTERLEFFQDPVNFMNQNEVELFIEEISPMNPQFIIVDTVARCMVGADENSTQHMGEFVDHVDQVRRYFNCGVLLVHHTGTNGKMRGSSALYAACDSVLFLDRTEATLVLHNENDKGGKNKYNQELASRFMRLIPVEVDIKGETVQGAVLEPTERIEYTNDITELSSNQKIILSAIEGHTNGLTASSVVDATSLSSSTVYYNLKQLIKMELIQKGDNHHTITELGMEELGYYTDSNDSN